MHRSERDVGKDRALTPWRPRTGSKQASSSENNTVSAGEDIGGSAKQLVSNLETSEIGGISKVSNPVSDFDAIIEDIDKAINMGITKSNPAEKVGDIENSILEKRGDVALSLGEDIREKGQAKIKDGLAGGFAVGWLKPKLSNTEGKAGRRKITKCEKGVEVATERPNSISEQKKGCWTRRTSRPMQDEMVVKLL